MVKAASITSPNIILWAERLGSPFLILLLFLFYVFFLLFLIYLLLLLICVFFLLLAFGEQLLEQFVHGFTGEMAPY